MARYGAITLGGTPPKKLRFTFGRFTSKFTSCQGKKKVIHRLSTGENFGHTSTFVRFYF